jgi:hypothetical protein
MASGGPPIRPTRSSEATRVTCPADCRGECRAPGGNGGVEPNRLHVSHLSFWSENRSTEPRAASNVNEASMVRASRLGRDLPSPVHPRPSARLEGGARVALMRPARTAAGYRRACGATQVVPDAKDLPQPSLRNLDLADMDPGYDPLWR